MTTSEPVRVHPVRVHPVRILYIDCFSGIAGDMMLGALLDLGVPEAHLRERLARLGPLGYELRTRRAQRHGIEGVDVQVDLNAGPMFVPVVTPAPVVHVAGGHDHGRRYTEIRALIEVSSLDAAEKRLALAIFDRLAVAEGKLHGIDPGLVHFHEVGGVDAIVDICGSAIGLAYLAVDEIVCAPLPVPRGFVTCAHGVMPLPAPATFELLRGATTAESPGQGEWVTPTGAAIATTIATSYGPIPAMTVEAIGYGVGDRNPPDRANLLRLIVGHRAGREASHDVLLETNIDDMSPELFGYLSERLFDAGALDVWLTPIQMKKGRPAVMLSVLAAPEKQLICESIVLRESTAIGLRRVPVERVKASRRIETVETPFGAVRVKVTFDGQTVLGRAPEYEDCRQLALEHGVPLKEVFLAASMAAPEH